MAADLNLLVPEFRVKVVAVLAECASRGFVLRPFFTSRTPSEQARLWRQSRTADQLTTAAARLIEKGAPWMAAILVKQPPTHGVWATNSLPGNSWHQFGEAVDCFLVENKHAIWNDKHPGYAAYASVARDQGLNAGFFWKGTTDTVHVQLREAASPLHTFTWSQIEAEMKRRFTDG